jgi:hypothetical protein
MHDIGQTSLETELESHGEMEEESEGFVGEGPLTEEQEVELASELLEVSHEQELEQFLSNLIRTVGGAVGQFARSDTGQALGGVLKDAARQALPIIGRAVGQWASPQHGGDIGGDLATQAGRVLGLELEGLSGEDAEFEVARQFVRFASEAARQACLAPPSTPPEQVAQTAAAQAAQVHAPGLLPRLRGRSGSLWPRSGRWMRRGRTIVLYGA